MNIPVDFLVILPMVTALIVILAAWIAVSFRDGRRDVKKLRTSMFHCRACGRVYTDPRTLPVMKCPVCGITNEAVRR